MVLSESTLRELQKGLAKAAIALVRSERQVTQVTTALRKGTNPERGDEVRISAVEFAGGLQPFVADMYTGPEGGLYEAHPGYVLTCWSPAGVHIRRHWHPDVREYVFVQEGELLELVSGKRTLAGEGFEMLPNQSHEYFFPAATKWNIVYSLMGDFEPDDAANDQACH